MYLLYTMPPYQRAEPENEGERSLVGGACGGLLRVAEERQGEGGGMGLGQARAKGADGTP